MLAAGRCATWGVALRGAGIEVGGDVDNVA